MRAPPPAPGGPIPQELARGVKLVLFDVDGVLTDGGAYMGQDPRGRPVELKRFDIQDGLGMKMLAWAGLEVVMISGRVSEATTLRAAELGVECHQDAGAHKLPVVREVMERMGVRWEEVAMLADDLPDLPVFQHVGLPAAVANAVPEIAERAVWMTVRRGGAGAAREFCDALLDARGERDRVVRRYVTERGG